MNRPLMFMNNSTLIEQLKTAVWENYREIKSGDFKGWYDTLNPIERAAWNVKFDELN